MLILDTNVLVRHLTGEPADQAARATTFLTETDEFCVSDVVVAELVYVLDSFYEAPRSTIATALRAIIGAPAAQVDDQPRLLRALELFETLGHDYADAYLVAVAEQHGDGAIVTYDRRLGRGTAVTRIEP